MLVIGIQWNHRSQIVPGIAGVHRCDPKITIERWFQD
jgi:hypothetical protein